MLTLQDCLDMAELGEDEVRAIADRAGIPDIVAAELGSHLLRCANGIPAIRRIIREDMALAEARGDRRRAVALAVVLARFDALHPGNPPRRPD